MSKEKQIDNKNCNGCLHFEACCKWTDFPKQIGFPVCRKFTPTNTPTCTNLHQSYTNLTPTYTNSKLEQIEEMAKVIKSSLDGLGYGNFNFTGDEFSTMVSKALYNAGYRKQEWISVDERLPKERTHVIVCDEGGIVGEAWHFKEGRFEWMEDESLAFVTHWMPLPEAPKMKGGAG